MRAPYVGAGKIARPGPAFCASVGISTYAGDHSQRTCPGSGPSTARGTAHSHVPVGMTLSRTAPGNMMFGVAVVLDSAVAVHAVAVVAMAVNTAAVVVAAATTTVADVAAGSTVEAMADSVVTDVFLRRASHHTPAMRHTLITTSAIVTTSVFPTSPPLVGPLEPSGVGMPFCTTSLSM